MCHEIINNIYDKDMRTKYFPKDETLDSEYQMDAFVGSLLYAMFARVHVIIIWGDREYNANEKKESVRWSTRVFDGRLQEENNPKFTGEYTVTYDIVRYADINPNDTVEIFYQQGLKKGDNDLPEQADAHYSFLTRVQVQTSMVQEFQTKLNTKEKELKRLQKIKDEAIEQYNKIATSYDCDELIEQATETVQKNQDTLNKYNLFCERMLRKAKRIETDIKRQKFTSTTQPTIVL